MKLSSVLCASVVASAVFAMTMDGAFAAANYNSSKSNTGNLTAGNGTAQPCPIGEMWNVATKKCVATSAVNYNPSKSNTGSNLTTSAKYHCGKGEWMLSNGDCVKNPPNNPN